MARTFKHTNEEILGDIRRICSDLKRTPTTREFTKLSIFPLSTVIYRFGSYSKAIKLADGEVSEFKKYTDDEIIQHFKDLSKKLGHVPLCSEYREDQLVCIQTIFRHFNSYSELCRRAGFKGKAEQAQKVTGEMLLDDLEKIINNLGRVPSVSEYNSEGTYKYNHFSKFFGGLKWAVSVLAQQNRIPEGTKIGRGEFKRA